jgi:hypothetical protein
MVALAIALGAPALAAGATDPGTAARLRALDCDRISGNDIRDVLAFVPAPRIIAISGSFDLVTMDAFARFLAAMGYPATRIRNPEDNAWSYASSTSSAAFAGMIAFHYEGDGMVPMLIGYSGGGMRVLGTLHELAGAFGNRIAVVNPLTGNAQPRTGIVDPFDGHVRPVLGLKVPYACAIATGKLPRLLLGQWTMLTKLRRVPDTVDEFTGLDLEWDAIAGTFPGAELYAATGSAKVRNVTLPASYAHLDLPRTEQLAANAATRAWIEAYEPGASLPAADPAVDTTNLLHAADIWYSVRKHWCLAAKQVADAGIPR